MPVEKVAGRHRWGAELAESKLAATKELGAKVKGAAIEGANSVVSIEGIAAAARLGESGAGVFLPIPGFAERLGETSSPAARWSWKSRGHRG